ncbi:MAG: V-type ATPase 116kDa subunit family protein [Candidatus Brocadiaceae bacterium]
MRKVRIFILGRDEERVTRALGSLGVVHLKSSVEESGGELQPEDLEDEIEHYTALLRAIRGLQDTLGLEAPEHPPTDDLPPLEEIEEVLATLEEKTEAQRQELQSIDEALRETEELIEELEPFAGVRSALNRLAQSEFLSVTAGELAPERMGALRQALPRGALVVELGREAEEERSRRVLIVCGRRRRFAVETALEEQDFEETEVPVWEEQTPDDVYRRAAGKLKHLRERREALSRSLRGIGGAYADVLRRAYGKVAQELHFARARRNFGTTWSTTVISGWVPRERAEQLQQTLRDATEGHCVVQISEPTPEEVEQGAVPTRVDHTALFAPFEMLVRGYGVPSYAEIEPTLMLGASFLLMFGLIFGDLGHGLVLIGAGFLVTRVTATGSAKNVGRLMVMAGVASAVFGTFFQGSFFGKALQEMGFPATVGFEPMRFEGAGASPGEHVMRYLLLAAAVGVVLISLGAILNVVNRVRHGDIAGGLLGRHGVVGVIFYWGALGWAVKLAVAGASPSDLWLGVPLIGGPLLLLAFRQPVAALLRRKGPAWEEGPIMGFFQGLIEAGETVMVYMANTFSFLRVAAFALSHAALCFTIFVLERLVNGLPGGPLWSAIVFIGGTAVIIALEGIIVAIQILRLEYYEFFTKFFSGEGTQYDPFTARLDAAEES